MRLRTASIVLTSLLAIFGFAVAAQAETIFKPIPTQFIAALGDPGASSGSGAQSWGLWRLDPGPRGVMLENYEQLKAARGVTPAQWSFDPADWWLEEHGLIMEKPDFPLPPGKYKVTGGREMTAILTIHATARDGEQRWELDNGAKLYDVTHLPCRSARYAPLVKGQSCSPEKAQRADFPVAPGAAMPNVQGCAKQDYAVLFVTAIEQDTSP